MKKIYILSVLLFILVKTAISQNYSGNYSVGDTGRFGSLKEAVDSLTYFGISGPVNLKLQPNYISNDTIVVPAISGVTAANRITISGDGTSNVYYYGNSAHNFVVKFRNAHFITLQNLNIKNTTTANDSCRVVVFEGQCDNIQILKCNINGTTPTAPSSQSSVIYAGPGGSNNIKIADCQITFGSYGIYFENASVTNDAVLHIENNQLLNFYFGGIFLNYQKNITVFHNTIYSEIGATSEKYALKSSNCQQLNLSCNTITVEYGTANHGITATSCTTTPAAPNLIINNMITVGAQTSGEGIKVIDGNYFNIDCNSVFIPTDASYSDNLSALDLEQTTQSDVLHNLVRNNIFEDRSYYGNVISMNFPHNADYINYNCIHAWGGIGFDGTQQYHDLAMWQSATGYDSHSIISNNLNYMNIAGGNLHIAPLVPTAVESRGTPIVGLNLDIDGNPRDPLHPDIGADEGNFQRLMPDVWTGNFTVSGIIYNSYGVNEDVPDTLTVLPGTDFKISSGSGFNIRGTINAQGTALNPIIFEPDNIEGDWAGMNIILNTGGKNDKDSKGARDSYLKYCIFKDSHTNSGGKSHSYGGALDIKRSNTWVENCKFINNSSEYGGAIYADNCDPIIINNLFDGNYANYNGGAVFLNNTTSALVFANNIFQFIDAANVGSAIYIESSDSKLYNNTIIDNMNSNISIIFIDNTNTNPNPTVIENSIILGGSQSAGIVVNTGATLNLKYSTVSPKVGFITGNVNPTMVNTFSPMFVDSVHNDFRLLPGSPCINGGDPATSITGFPTDFDGNPRKIGSAIDIGAYESNGLNFYANAGTDQQLCSNSTVLTGNDPTPNLGTWSQVSGSGNILSPNSSTTQVESLSIGDNIFRWSITNGTNTVSDDVVITNNQVVPIIDSLVNLYSLNGAAIASFNIVASGLNYTYQSWTESNVNLVAPNTFLLYGLNFGNNQFHYYLENDFCNNTTLVNINIGMSLETNGGNIDWNDPSSWNLGFIPGTFDSVTVYNSNLTMNGDTGYCNQIYIGSGSQFKIQEDGSGNPSAFYTNNLVVEGNPSKVKSGKGPANLNIGSGGNVFVEQSIEKKGIKGSNGGSLTVGSGGNVFVEQSIEKGPKGNATLDIGSGGNVFVEQSIEKGGVSDSAKFYIRDGGSLVFEPSTVKGKSGTVSGLQIGSGGNVFVEQSIEKSKGNAITVGSGGNVFVEQSIEKSKGGAANLVLSGGNVFVEQSIEKSSKDVLIPDLKIGQGGRLVIGKNPVTGIPSSVTATNIDVDGGQLLVGTISKSSPAKSTDGGEISCNQLNVSPGMLDTVNVIFGTDAQFTAFPVTINPRSCININSGATMTILSGASINIPLSTYNADITIQDGASLVDMNSVSSFAGESHVEQGFSLNERKYVSTPVTGSQASIFGVLATVKKWNEPTAAWQNVTVLQNLLPMAGYSVTIPAGGTVTYKGVLNCGNLSIPVTTASYIPTRGWNFVGNPYPSAIDWESVTLNGLNPFVYQWNSASENYSVYQQGGTSLNGGTSIILPDEGFFTKAMQNATGASFSLTNNNRVHAAFIPAKSVKGGANTLLLSTTGSTGYSDQMMLRYDALAGTEYEDNSDAVKLFVAANNHTPQIYSVTPAGIDLALNTLSDPGSQPIAINVGFLSPIAGTYTMTVQNTLPTAALLLKDKKTGLTYDMTSVGSFTFNHGIADSPDRFVLLFNGSTKTDNISVDNISVYSHNGMIYFENINQTTSVSIYDVTGKLLIQNQINNSVSQIQLPAAQGIYLVKLQQGNQIVTKKVVNAGF